MSEGPFWTASVRKPDLTLSDPIQFTSAVLAEGYNVPDTLVLVGRLSEMAVAMQPSYGVVLTDPAGTIRFCGFADEIEAIAGTSAGSVLFRNDLDDFSYRFVWPVPTAAWSTAGQTAAYDVQTGTAEARLLHYVDANIGPSSYHSGTQDRRLPGLRIPTSAGRGPTAKTSARFDNLLELTAALAETAGLRMRIVQSFDPDGTPHLDFTLTTTPDLSASLVYGDGSFAGGGLLGDDSRAKIGMPKATTVLSAAGGEGAARLLSLLDKETADESTLWDRRREAFVDQRGTTDTTEITEGLTSAWADAAGLREVAAALGPADVEVGDDIPVGTRVTAAIGPLTIVDRIRQLTTTIQANDGDPTESKQATFGSPDAGPAAPAQRIFARAYKQIRQLSARVSNVERNL